jgi:hypothetical protein
MTFQICKEADGFRVLTIFFDFMTYDSADNLKSLTTAYKTAPAKYKGAK